MERMEHGELTCLAAGFGASNSGGFGQNNTSGGGMFGNTNNTSGGGFGASTSGASQVPALSSCPFSPEDACCEIREASQCLTTANLVLTVLYL